MKIVIIILVKWHGRVLIDDYGSISASVQAAIRKARQGTARHLDLLELI